MLGCFVLSRWVWFLRHCRRVLWGRMLLWYVCKSNLRVCRVRCDTENVFYCYFVTIASNWTWSVWDIYLIFLRFTCYLHNRCKIAQSKSTSTTRGYIFFDGSEEHLIVAVVRSCQFSLVFLFCSSSLIWLFAQVFSQFCLCTNPWWFQWTLDPGLLFGWDFVCYLRYLHG